jgi:hypothetical protein
MQLDEIETIAIKILQDAKGRFLFPYQIFNRIKKQDPALGKKIEADYSTDPSRPTMGQGAGIYYSPASYVSQALKKLSIGSQYKDRIKQEWFDPSDIKIEGIIPGSKEETSIWAWQ